jgi:hypothetical protein
MINTMSDRFMVWQPRIEFYNSPQTLYAYVMKQTPNNALGIFSQTASTLTEGGVRSFGKYFFRINPYYRIEVAGNQFQSMYKPDRGYLQSEDAYHGIFGRVGYVPEAIIYENTPSSYISELEREETKWLPTFDIRNFVYLHGLFGMGGFMKWETKYADKLLKKARREGNDLAGMKAFLENADNRAIIVDRLHIKESDYLNAVSGCNDAITAYDSNNPEQARVRYNVAFTFLRDTVAGSIRKLPKDEREAYGEFHKSLEFQTRPKIEIVNATIALLDDSVEPKLPLRGEYSESLVTRGILSEPIWTLQLLLTFYAMLFPGTLEMAFPYIGEIVFLSIMILLTHPKFTGPLMNYLFGIVEPPLKPFGPSRIGTFFNAIISFTLHDIPVGVFELVASTTVYLMKLVIKPLELYRGFKGTIAEVKSHAAGQKSAGTWPSFLETTANPSIIDYLFKFRWAPAIGISIFLVASSGTPLAATMYLTKHVAWGISAVMALLLAVWPTLINWLRAHEKLKEEKDYFKKKELYSKVIGFTIASAILGAMILSSGFLAPFIEDFIPLELVLRASTIFIASFLFGPGAAWLMATPRGKRVEGTFNPPEYRSMTRVFAMLLGWAFILAGVYLSFAGIPNIAEYPVIASMMPTGDGASGVFMPAFGKLLRLPWQFSVFFNVIIGGAIVLGSIGYVAGTAEYASRVLWKKRNFDKTLHSEDVSRRIAEWYTKAINKSDGAMTDYVKKEILIPLCEEINYYIDDTAATTEAKKVWDAVKKTIVAQSQPSQIVRKGGVPEGEHDIAVAKVAGGIITDYYGVDNGIRDALNALLGKVVSIEGLTPVVVNKVEEMLGGAGSRQALLNGKTIKVVEGNDRLMRFTEGPDIILLDIDALMYNDLLFMEFIHELLHAKLSATQTRAGPIEEEINVTIQEVELFLLFPPEVQDNILKALAADNDLDDKEFREILKAAQDRGIEKIKEDIKVYVLANAPQLSGEVAGGSRSLPFISSSMSAEEIWSALYSMDVKEDVRLERFKAPENNKGQPITAFDHVRNLVIFEDRLRQAEAVDDIETMTSIVTERRDLKAPELAPYSVMAFVDYYRNVRNSPDNMSKFMVLRMAIVLHDIGKLAGHGEDAISGEKYAKEDYIPALIANKAITEEEGRLLTALIYLHTDFGTLHFGEVLPSSVEKYLAANNVSGRYRGWFYELAPILYVLDVGSVGAVNGGRLSTTHLGNAMWMAKPENVAQLTAGWNNTRLYLGFCGETSARLGYWPIIDFTKSAAINRSSYPSINTALEAIPQADRAAFDDFLRDKMSFEAHAIYIFRHMNEFSTETQAKQSELVKFFYIIFKLRQAMPEFTMLHFTPTTDEREFARQLCAKIDNITMEEVASFTVNKGENAVEVVSSRFGLPIKADGAKVIYNTTAPAQQLLLIGIAVPAPETENTIKEVTARIQAAGLGEALGQVIAVDNPESLIEAASERGMTGIFIDSSIKVKSMDNAQFDRLTRDLSEIKLTKDLGMVFTATNIDRQTRDRVKELIIAVIGTIEHKSPAEIFGLAEEAMKGNPGTFYNNVAQLRGMLAARRAQLLNSGSYSTIAIDGALVSEKNVALATTERVALSEPTFAMNVARTRDHGTVNCFIYGEIFNTEEKAKAFLTASGYEGDFTDIVFVNKMSKTKDEMVAEIGSRTGITNPDNIGIRYVNKELGDSSSKSGRMLEVQAMTVSGRNVLVTVNTYEALLRILKQWDGTLAGLESVLPGAKYDETGRVFIYLPKTLPIDYGQEIDTYRNAVILLSTAA